ncbi:SDR family NAD(P)-dependent oxidoreductase [Flavobacteriaceae bacterium]|nr:SDR family NAD(P)-dependent oxidoreductase [Flavobacteriaceae bacterium]
MKKYALVTGSSSGIGLEIAKILASKGYNIILTARRKERLINLSKSIISDFKVDCDFVSCDLSEKVAPDKIYEFCIKNKYEIEFLVNNAGYAIPSTFIETTMEDEEKFLRVLGISVIALTKLFLPAMIKNKNGRVMIISSVAAFAPPSSIQSLYGPIKTFMNRFSDSINSNYNKNGITSTAVCPGFTYTEFHTSSGVQKQMDSVPKFLKKSAKRVANEAVIDTLRGKSISIPTKTYKIFVFILKIVPIWVFSLLVRILAPGRYDKKVIKV